ncbi:MAG: hypothetical protein KAT30_17830, partial [Candidatus Krumholzibacteria bacterium]|nr:hypothetical protein [Candidatus Krumholzibacteria bacterium]
MTPRRRISFIPLVGLVLSLCLFSALPHEASAFTLTHSVTLEPHRVSVDHRDGVAVVRALEDDYYTLFDEGLPELPFRIVNFVLPQGEVVDRVEFTGGITVVLETGIDVKKAPPAKAADGTVADSAPLVPGEGNVYPPVLGKSLGTGYLHGYGIASVAVFPLRTDGGRLTLTRDIVVKVFTRPGNPGDDIAARQRFIEGFRDKVQRQLETLVVNPADAVGYHFGEVRVKKEAGGFQPTSFPSLEGSPVDYVIITNDSLVSAYQALADWKTAKGVPTVIRTTEWIAANYRHGSDLQETIRSFVKDAYARWGITYVLIGGDSEQVPPRFGSSFYLGTKEIPVDMYYACLDGDWNADHDQYFGEGGAEDEADLYAEVYVGRFPSSNSDDINLMTAKIIDYESSTDSDFARNFIFLTEVLFPTDWVVGNPISMNGTLFSENVYTSSLTDPNLSVVRMYETDDLYPGSVHESYSAAMDSLNAGYNQVIQIGHGFRFNMSVGDGSIVNVDADNMTNAGRYSNYYLLNCTAVAYTYFCLAEHLLRSPGGGAASVIGANESAFPITSSLLMYEYYDLLYLQDVVHIGETFARSRLARTALAELNDNADLYTHYIYTLLGDPEMPLWTNPLGTLNITYVSDVNVGT